MDDEEHLEAKLRRLSDQGGNLVGKWTSFCGHILTDVELERLTESDLTHMVKISRLAMNYILFDYACTFLVKEVGFRTRLFKGSGDANTFL